MPGDAAQGRRIAHRSAGIRAERGGHQAGRQRHARAARRAAGEMVAAPRIDRRRPRQIERRPADRELVGGELAHEDAARRLQPLRHHRVRRRDVVDQHLGVAGGRQPRDVDDVLEPVGHAVQGPAQRAGRHLALGAARRLHRPLGRELDVGVIARIELVRPIEQRLRVLDGRELARADQVRGFRKPEIGKLAHRLPPSGRRETEGQRDLLAPMQVLGQLRRQLPGRRDALAPAAPDASRRAWSARQPRQAHAHARPSWSPPRL